MSNSTVPAAIFSGDNLLHLPPVTPEAKIVSVTPDLAKQWLQTNTHNRNVRPREVTNYARDMAAGNWQMNGEAIKFAADGALLDGQHRLNAVVKAGVPVLMLIITGLPSETQSTMDSGAKRTTSDALSLQGNKHASVLAAVLRRVIMWDRGDYKFTGNYTPTTAECAELLDERPQIHRSAETAVQVHRAFPNMPQSVVGTAHHVFSAINGGDAVWFFARIGDGAQLAAGHPVLTLRNRILSERADQRNAPNWRHMAYLIRTWNAVREGRSLSKIQQAPDAAMPMPK